MGQIVHASFAPLESSDMDSRAPNHNPEGAQPFVRLTADVSGKLSDTRLTDEAREAAIKLTGKAVERHMANHKKALLDYDITNCLADKGLADRYRLMAEEAARLMALLIKGRSSEAASRMEQERGLA